MVILPESFLFLGSPKVAADILERLLLANCPIKGVVTKEPKRRSRGTALSVTPVEEVANKFGVEIKYSLQDYNLNSFDLGIVVAYGKIIAESVLSSLPMINVHFSLLPNLRGAAPVERALLNGDIETGVTLMKVDRDLDAGLIYDQSKIAIDPEDDITALYRKLTEIAVKIVIGNLTNNEPEINLMSSHYLLSNLPSGFEQDGQVTWAPKIKTGELKITAFDTVKTALNKVKLNGAYFNFLNRKIKVKKAGSILQILDRDDLVELSLFVNESRLYIKLSDAAVELSCVVPESKSQMSGIDFFNGYVKPNKHFMADNS